MRACEEEGDGERGGGWRGGGAMLTAISECEVDPVSGFIGCIETKIRTLCYWGFFFFSPLQKREILTLRGKRARRALLFFLKMRRAGVK